MNASYLTDMALAVDAGHPSALQARIRQRKQ
jgi:hypothetical protein